MPIFALGVLIAVIAVVFVIRTKDPTKQSRFLKQAALALMGTFSLLVTLFVAGKNSRTREDGKP